VVLELTGNKYIEHRAASAGCVRFLAMLKKYVVNVHEATADEHGLTPIQYARSCGQLAAVALLSEGNEAQHKSNIEAPVCGVFTELMRLHELQRDTENNQPIGAPAGRGTISALRNIIEAEEVSL
jgi:hypothetical protein